MQTSARPTSGLGLLDSYTPLGGNQTRLYYALREAVPIIDAAIFKTVRLTGGFEVRCADERLQDKLDHFIRNVPVGGNQCGLESFVSTYFEQLLTCGTAVGEMVTDADGHIAAQTMLGLLSAGTRAAFIPWRAIPATPARLRAIPLTMPVSKGTG